jgi:NADH-quinone oxidoreductase subunit G
VESGHFLELPRAFARSGEGELVVPRHHIFGSEEMSARAPGIAECAPEPYLGLSPGGAAALGLGEGDQATFETDAVSLSLPIKVIAGLVPGIAVLPVGLPGLEGVLPPFYAHISPASPEGDTAAGPAPTVESAEAPGHRSTAEDGHVW